MRRDNRGGEGRGAMEKKRGGIKEEKEKGKSNKSTNFQTNKLVCQNFDDNLVLSC